MNVHLNMDHNTSKRSDYLPESIPLPINHETLAAGAGAAPRRWLNPWRPSQFIEFNPTKNFILMGDCHLTRGGLTVLGGFAGVGKSRASLALAIAGAQGVSWMGHAIHSRFRTLIIQCENGAYRLKTELGEALGGENLDDWLLITPPPSYGLAFQEAGFRAELQKLIGDFQPGLIVIDPWNRTADGDKQADYRAALDFVFECLPEDPEEKPAILIVHHMRKKAMDSQRKQGRDLLHELAGSYQIGSAARCVFVLEPASNHSEDQTVVLTCCKNNDGREGMPSAWKRRNGLFDPAGDFDMEAFLADGESSGSRNITFFSVANALRGMCGEKRTEVIARLVKAGVCARSRAYTVINEYAENIVEDTHGRFYWREDDA